MKIQTKSFSNANIDSLKVKEVSDLLKRYTWAKDVPTKVFRRWLNFELAKLGWSDRVRIDANSKIDITAVKEAVGLCVQTGNMSRYYADLLKLEAIFRKGSIESAIYIVPTSTKAKTIGSNTIRFDRVADELKIFNEIITVPMVLIAFED